MLSPRTVNETRAQYTYSDLKAPPTDPVGPAVSISGVASFGTLSGSPTRRTNSLYQVVDNLSHQAGAHALRAGVDFLYNDDTHHLSRGRSAAATRFRRCANFLTGVYNNAGFTQTFGDTMVSQTNPNLGVYAQDEWKISSRLTLNAGLRYDLQFLQTINTDTNNLSPRVGVVWSPSDTSKTLVRASAGRVLRSRPAEGAGQRAPLGRQHDRPQQPSPDRREPVADAGGSAGVPQHSERTGTVGYAAKSDDYGPQHAGSAIAPGGRRDRAPARLAKYRERRLSIPARPGLDHLPSIRTFRRAWPRAPTTGVVRTRTTPTTASIRPKRIRRITAFSCRSCSGQCRGATTGSATRCPKP